MRTSLKLAIGGFTVLVLLVVFVYANAVVSRRRAGILLRDLQEFGSVQEFSPTFEALRQRYGNSLKRLDGCTPAYCAWEIRVSNRPLPFVYQIPYTEVSALFQGKNNSADSVLVEYRTARTKRTSPIVHVQMDACPPGCERSFYLNPHGRSTELSNGLVEFNADATAIERRAALSFNLECFTRIEGCDDIAQLLPSVWKHAVAAEIVSRLPSMADASWDRLED